MGQSIDDTNALHSVSCVIIYQSLDDRVGTKSHISSFSCGRKRGAVTGKISSERTTTMTEIPVLTLRSSFELSGLDFGQMSDPIGNQFPDRIMVSNSFLDFRFGAIHLNRLQKNTVG